jgi:hypothetical protein
VLHALGSQVCQGTSIVVTVAASIIRPCEPGGSQMRSVTEQAASMRQCITAFEIPGGAYRAGRACVMYHVQDLADGVANAVDLGTCNSLFYHDCHFCDMSMLYSGKSP